MATFQVFLGTYEIGSETDIEVLKFARDRRLDEAPIIRSHFTKIPEGKLEKLKITIQGQIHAASYTLLRTALMALQAAVHAGAQDFTVDDERYARIIDSKFDYSFHQNTCIMKYSLTLFSGLPFFLAETPDSDTRTPTSGSGYTLNNGGQLWVPVKLVITPTAELADDCQWENTTLGLLFKYTGTVGAGKDLVIDVGYDAHNQPTFIVTNDGTSDIAHFEGDPPRLDPGDNTVEFTGGSDNVQIVTYWRKQYYC